MGERVSVVMPVYDGAAHCVEAMRSVFAQTRVPDEVVVVDDGSTDASLDLLRALDGPLPLRIVAQENQGQSAARNAGVRAATGTLVAFIDQDDLWTSEHLERLCAPLERDRTVAWAFSDFDELDADGRVVTRGYHAHHRVPTGRMSIDQLLASDLMVLPSASVLRKDAVEAVGGFDPDLSGYEDDDLYIRMFRAGLRAVYVPRPLTGYRVHAGGCSATDAFLASRVRFLAKMRDAVPDHVRSNRYWVQDCLYPRLLNTTLYEYAAALRAGRTEEAARIAETAEELTRVVGASGRRRRLVLRLLRYPTTLRVLAAPLRLVPLPLRPRVGDGYRAVLAVVGVRLPAV